ncbi:MAG: right-handed parallel beta-helix repeat-containing protein, partial [Planctomycetota bacterium]
MLKKLLLTLLFTSTLFATVPIDETKRQYFTCNGSTTEYTFTAPVNSSDDVNVLQRLISTGVETELVEDTDYTITNTGSSYLEGGVVTISPALAATYQVIIYREIVQSQETVAGAITPISIVAALDKLQREIQDIRYDLNYRYLRIPQSDASTISMAITNSVDRASTFPYYGDDGALTTAAGVTDDAVVVSAYMETVVDDATAALARATLEITTENLINVINVKDPPYNAVGDGSNDDTVEIQAALTAAVDGDTVYFPPGTYLISAVFTALTVDVSLRGDNAVISASTVLASPVFSWTSRDDFTVSGLTYDGEETYGGFSGSSLADVYGLIYLNTCDNVKVSNISGLECRNVVQLEDCTSCTVEDIYHIGVLTSDHADANYHITVHVAGGTDNKVSRVHSENGGAGVTGTGSTERLIISGCTGTQLWDNGIYISSGTHCVITGNSFDNFDAGAGQCIKARGSYHIISDNRLTDVVAGIRITGLSDTIGGDGCVVVGNTVDTYTGRGIDVTNLSGGPFLSNVTISNNIIQAGTGTGGSGDAIEVRVLDGLVISNNIIIDNDDTYAVLVYGVSGTEISDATITGNVLTDIVTGIRIIYGDNMTLTGNVFETVSGSQAIELRNVTNSAFIGNSCPEAGTFVIRDDDAYTNTGNVYAFNRGSVSVDAAQQILNRQYSNFTTTTAAMTFAVDDATPSVLGGTIFITGDDDGLNVTDFDDGDIGQVITILGGEAFTTVKHDIAKINLVGAADWVSALGASLVLW